MQINFQATKKYHIKLSDKKITCHNWLTKLTLFNAFDIFVGKYEFFSQAEYSHEKKKKEKRKKTYLYMYIIWFTMHVSIH